LENALATPAREITSRHEVDKRSLLLFAAQLSPNPEAIRRDLHEWRYEIRAVNPTEVRTWRVREWDSAMATVSYS
jgi:hypothetical protein